MSPWEINWWYVNDIWQRQRSTPCLFIKSHNYSVFRPPLYDALGIPMIWRHGQDNFNIRRLLCSLGLKMGPILQNEAYSPFTFLLTLILIIIFFFHLILYTFISYIICFSLLPISLLLSYKMQFWDFLFYPCLFFSLSLYNKYRCRFSKYLVVGRILHCFIIWK